MSVASHPEVSIVIVTYNSASVIDACLESIPGGGPSSETLVVDNGSSDGTVERVRQRFPWVRLIMGHGNVGFAGGNNLGFQASHGAYLFVLNPDTQLHPGALRRLVDFAEAHPQVGMIGPRLVHPDGRLQHSTFRFPDMRQAIFGFFERLAPTDSVLNGRYPVEAYARVRPAEHLLGAAILVRRAVWQQVGGMDERFQLYFEETDWCYRVRRAGWQLMYLPDATVMHIGAHATQREPEAASLTFARSRAYFYRKHYGRLHTWALKLITVVGLAFWLARSLVGWTRGRLPRERLQRRLVSYWGILRA